MNLFHPFYNMKVGIVDLSALSVETIPLDQNQVMKHFGGAAMNRALFDQHQEGALIFGTGPLTGSFAPASSLMIATFPSPRFEQLCDVPFMIRTGPDMKFSGIDFLVVKGTAPEQSVLYVNKSGIRILPAGNLRDLPIPELMGELKKTTPFFQTSLVTGPAADHSVSCASVSVGLKGSLDKAGLALLMAKKNLKGVLFGGTGGLPFNKDNPDKGKSLEKQIAMDRSFKQRGFFSVLKKLDGGRDAGKLIKQSGKKDMACYRCPSPCMTHVIFSWQDPEKKEIEKIQDGLLLLDHMGCVSLAGTVGRNILPVMKRCLYYGLDPSCVAGMLPAHGALAECLKALDTIVFENLPYTRDIDKAYQLFGDVIPPVFGGDLWKKRVGLAMILGICPIFLLRFRHITDVDLLAFISPNEDAAKTLQEGLSSEINYLFTV